MTAGNARSSPSPDRSIFPKSARAWNSIAPEGWEYGLLYDARYMTGRPTTDMLRGFADAMKPRPGEPFRGPVAVVSTDSVTYVLACACAAMVKAHTAFAVFRNRDEADAWLSDRVGA